MYSCVTSVSTMLTTVSLIEYRRLWDAAFWVVVENNEMKRIEEEANFDVIGIFRLKIKYSDTWYD